MASNIAIPVASLATGPLLARGLGVDDRGALAAIMAVLMIAPALFSFGLQDASVLLYRRAAARFSISASAVTIAIAILASALSALLTITIPFVQGGAAPLLASAYVGTMIGLMPLRGMIVAAEHFRAIAAEKWTQATLRVVGTIFLFATQSMTVESALLVLLGSTALGGIPLVLFARAKLARGGLPRGVTASALVRLGWPIWLAAVAQLALLRLDQVTLSFIGTSYELGLYVVAATLADVALIASTAIRLVILPRLAGGESSRLARAAPVVFSLGLLGVLLSIWLGDPLISWLFGGPFSSASEILPWLVVASTLGVWLDIVSAQATARGRAGHLAVGSGAGAVLSLIGCFALYPVVGVDGVVIARIAGYAIAAVAASWTAFRAGD
ncbi:oligosaccharide flippase family protein [Microbacterium sp. NPDC079995]|uniref:oligosaccharide flippase family protein n=1 Tax=unclassified Microbacterium TaxID=2609290 RepID=UPI0034507FBE